MDKIVSFFILYFFFTIQFSSSSHLLKRLSSIRVAPSGTASIELKAVAMKPIAKKRTPILFVRLWMRSATVMIRDS